MKYLYVCSTDSFKYHPTNSAWDFIIELPQSLAGCEYVALGEIQYSAYTGRLIVCSDICEESYIRDRSMPILRRVSQPGELDRLQFLRTTRSEIQRIRISILDEELQEPIENIGPVYCTLIFKS